jgi:hypothetical protein
LSTTSGAETIVTSTGSAFSSAVNDIVIRAAGWGVTTDFLVTSRTPYRLVIGYRVSVERPVCGERERRSALARGAAV